jgi:organic radical activating enzyme
MSSPPTTSAFRFRRTLSVMPTYACTARCRNCGTVSSPDDRNVIALDTMLAAIDQAHDLGFVNVVFTGGEPTMRWSDLVQAIRHAARLKLPTRVVTNGHWAADTAESSRRVQELSGAGLQEINFSTGDEHVKFVPLGNVANGVVAALAHSLSVAVMVELRAARVVTKNVLLSHPTIAALDQTDKTKVRIIESPWMPLTPSTIEEYPDGIAINRNNIAGVGGCDSVLQTYVIQADGRIGACCGLGMRITPELNVGVSKGEQFLRDAISEAESDLLKLILHYKGPEKVLAWAATKDSAIAWENMYAHKCQACLRIYRDPAVAEVVRKHHAELIGEVLQAAWLEDECYPTLARPE